VDGLAVIVDRSEAERRGRYRFSRYFSPLRREALVTEQVPSLRFYRLVFHYSTRPAAL
jgi:hypothetical protein